MKTETKFRPILFSAPMIKALLSGQKTMTRRTLKATVEPQPARFEQWGNALKSIPEGAFVPTSNSGKIGIFEPQFVKCPYGKIGDILWVRETVWQTGRWEDGPIDSWEGKVPKERPKELDISSWGSFGVAYRAGTLDGCKWDSHKDDRGFDWRPSIFMPRWASRITLEITNIRVERLQSITEEDAIAEGSQEPSLVPLVGACLTERQVYAKLWNKINGAGAWESDPFVWVIEFKRLTNEAS